VPLPNELGIGGRFMRNPLHMMTISGLIASRSRVICVGGNAKSKEPPQNESSLKS